jgi:hypothetical protein
MVGGSFLSGVVVTAQRKRHRLKDGAFVRRFWNQE